MAFTLCCRYLAVLLWQLAFIIVKILASIRYLSSCMHFSIFFYSSADFVEPKQDQQNFSAVMSVDCKAVVCDDTLLTQSLT